MKNVVQVWMGRLAVVVLVVWAGRAGAVTRYVSLTGSATPPYTNLAMAATNIQTAIAAASSGDEIQVADGLYLVNRPIDVYKPLTLRSASNRGAVLDAQRLGRVIEINHTNCLVEGFVIRNGVSPTYGGGVYIIGANSIVRDCLVVSNQSWGAGGVFIQANGVRIERCDILHNLATYWGGGMVFYDGTTGSAEGCTIAKNVSSNYAGGVALQEGGTVSNCWIADNYAVAEAGGASLELGGTLVNSVVVGNRAGNISGGFHAHSGGLVLNCTVVSNSAGVQFGGTFMSHATSINCIVYFNEAPLYADIYTSNQVRVDGCCVGTETVGSNFTNAPTFVDFAARNFRLAEGSSCIDTGLDLPLVIRDFDGTTRPRAGVLGGAALYDVGAYEFVPELKQYFALTQPVIGYANKDWSFMTAWNLANGRLEISPHWYNGSSAFTYTLDTAYQWVAIFLYDEGTMQTRQLRWAHRQQHIQ